jgi:hypothetical protein
MNEEEMRKTINESGVLNRYLIRMPYLPLYPLDSDETIKRYKEDAAYFEESEFQKATHHCAFDTRTDLVAGGGSFSSADTKTPEAHQKNLPNMSAQQLRVEAQNQRYGIDSLRDVQLLIPKLIDSSAKEEYSKGSHTVTLRLPTSSRTWTFFDWDKFVNQVTGKIAVVELAILLRQKILAIYETEIDERKNSAKAKEIIKRMTSIVKNADKIRPTIANANASAQRALDNHGKPHVKTSKVYIEAYAKFSDLSNEHRSLRTQLEFYTTELPETANLPSLRFEDTSAKDAIERVWRNLA